MQFVKFAVAALTIATLTGEAISIDLQEVDEDLCELNCM